MKKALPILLAILLLCALVLVGCGKNKENTLDSTASKPNMSDRAKNAVTKGGDIIRSRTYNAFFPLMAVAGIYLIMVLIFSHFVTLLERRLKQSER